MKQFTLCTLMLFSLSICFAQSSPDENYNHTFGKVSQYEMSMKQYPEDPDAEAVVIHELGEFFFLGGDEGIMLHMYFTVKIKILKQARLKYADFEIPYYISGHRGETVDMIEGHTFNYTDGKLTQTPLNVTKIYKEKVDDNWRLMKIAMPDVREGSVVELKYHIKTPYFINMRAWEFQKKIPVVHSSLVYKAIPYYEFNYIVRGITEFDVFDRKEMPFEQRYRNLVYKELAYTFGMNKLPAFKDEEFITSPKNYMVGMEFQLSKIHRTNGRTQTFMSSWPEINKKLLAHSDYGKYINNSKKQGYKILPILNLLDKPAEEQIEIISTYVKNNYKWNEQMGKYATQSVGNFMKNKTGNAADINLFLTGLLQAAGLPAEPVTISTRKHGAISIAHPFVQHLNYVIALVELDSSLYFIDATNPLLAYNELPEECINVQGLVTNKSVKEEWVFVGQNTMAKTNHTFYITVSPEKNSMNVAAEYEALGNNAYRYRKMHIDNSNNFKDFFQKRTGLVIQDDIKTENEKELSLPFKMSFNFDTPVENMGDKLFIHPFANIAIKENMFKQSERKLTIDLVFLRGSKYTSTIEIPAGYKVEYIPKSSSISRKQIDINYTVSQSDNKINIEAEYEFETNMYAFRDYIPLKMYIDEVIKKFGIAN